MKKGSILFVALTLGVFLGVNAQAAPKAAASKAGGWTRPYGMAGCGLGIAVVGKDGSQILGATTNGTSSNQLFAITFGTLGCEDGPNASTAQKMDQFVDANLVALAGDVARGEGETIASLNAILECGNKSALGQTLKTNFDKIFPHERVKTMEVTDSVINVILDDNTLANSCKGVKLG